MEKIIINGPAKLSGSVKIQGAKNSAMRLMILPLVAPGKFTFENIPSISSTKNLASISETQGAIVRWTNNQVTIDTSGVQGQKLIKQEDFYHTSGGIYAIPLLASRFGSCEVEKSSERGDTGGDAIGSRTMEPIIKTLAECGIETQGDEKIYHFTLASTSPFTVDAHDSFAASTNALIAAMFKKGKSKIRNFTRNPEFPDTIKFLKSAGAQIEEGPNEIVVNGPARINSTRFRCMSDKNDFITWLFAAIATRSEIQFENVNLGDIHVEPIFEILAKWQVTLVQIDSQIVRVDLEKLNLQPVDIMAGNYPLFHSDWQPLISPILTQIEGKSTVVDALFDNRMRHWEQLRKMGAKFEFFQDPNYPEKNGNPRAVKVFGLTKLVGTQLQATDVRAGAAFVIAGLIAEGKTEITGVEHIERGYEGFANRLRNLKVSFEL